LGSGCEHPNAPRRKTDKVARDTVLVLMPDPPVAAIDFGGRRTSNTLARVHTTDYQRSTLSLRECNDFQESVAWSLPNSRHVARARFARAARVAPVRFASMPSRRPPRPLASSRPAQSQESDPIPRSRKSGGVLAGLPLRQDVKQVEIPSGS